MCAFNSQSWTFFYQSSFETIFCRNCKWIFGVLWGLWWKRKYLHIKTRQKHSQKLLWDICIQLTDFNLSFDKAILKPSYCRICKFLCGALGVLWWKRKYLHTKTEQKHCEKLLGDVCIQLTGLNLSCDWTVLKHSFCRICKGISGALWGLLWKSKYLHIKTTQKHSEKLLGDVHIHLTELILCFDWTDVKHCFYSICKWIFGVLWGLQWKRKYLHIKTTQKLSEKLLCDVCILLTELNLSFDWAVLNLSFSRICKWIFGTLIGLLSKRQYLHIKTTQKHSEKLLCDVCIHLTVLILSSDWAVLKHSFCRTCKWIFGALWGLFGKRICLHIKTTLKVSV